MKLSAVIEYLGADASAIDPALLARDVLSFAIDSRDVTAGDLFFALSQPEYKQNGFNGEFEDATRYVKSSLENGAVAAVVRRDRFEEHKEELAGLEGRLLFVDDVIASLQRLAHQVYLAWGKKVIAITGSAGKTTAKELTAHVLEGSGRKVLRNIKNYNNGLGHPLTVLNLAKDPSYDVAVLEMGMSTPLHEIARLCRITPPDVATVLNVLPVHLEYLGTIENIAAAKAEIVEGLNANGVAILNADDPRVAAMKAKAPNGVITFGIDMAADISAKDIETHGFGTTTFTLVTPQGEARVNFPLNGKHNILNALAAAAAGHSFGMTGAVIAESLGTVAAPPQRGEILHFAAGFTVINDSYNSNPAALLSMVETLVTGASEGGRRIVVAGEMMELGDHAAEEHRETGRKMAKMGIDTLVGVRGLANDMIEAAKNGGLRDAKFAADSVEAGEIVSEIVKTGDTILIKGSRSVKTERVLERLTEKFDLEEKRAVKR